MSAMGGTNTERSDKDEEANPPATRRQQTASRQPRRPQFYQRGDTIILFQLLEIQLVLPLIHISYR
jgi:hypothetical protein